MYAEICLDSLNHNKKQVLANQVLRFVGSIRFRGCSFIEGKRGWSNLAGHAVIQTSRKWEHSSKNFPFPIFQSIPIPNIQNSEFPTFIWK